jgi:inosine-uridine nucleoside N-ribohydrolase
MKRVVLIDTDLSFDDYVAILFLLKHPLVEVRAVTVANGVVHIRPGLENIQRLLALTGHPHIPVAAGFEPPLSQQRAFPAGWRLLFDYGPRLSFPRVRKNGSPSQDAVDLICQQILESDQPITFVTLGPLTNLALALRKEPALAHQLEEIVISGGAIYVPGTIPQDIPGHPNRVAEWNFYLDPAAAATVLASGASLRLIPLDVTHVSGQQPLLFGRDFVKSLADAARGPDGKQLARILRVWRMMSPQYTSLPIWDGAVAALAVDPSIGTDWREMALQVVQEPEALAGQTRVSESGPPNARVCLKGDQKLLEDAYSSIMATPPIELDQIAPGEQ